MLEDDKSFQDAKSDDNFHGSFQSDKFDLESEKSQTVTQN